MAPCVPGSLAISRENTCLASTQASPWTWAQCLPHPSLLSLKTVLLCFWSRDSCISGWFEFVLRCLGCSWTSIRPFCTSEYCDDKDLLQCLVYVVPGIELRALSTLPTDISSTPLVFLMALFFSTGLNCCLYLLHLLVSSMCPSASSCALWEHSLFTVRWSIATLPWLALNSQAQWFSGLRS